VGGGGPARKYLTVCNEQHDYVCFILSLAVEGFAEKQGSPCCYFPFSYKRFE